ncbi:hypothetical protein HYFRA_00008870 [Hymenoscyphus fraxineus]|uniref:Auxin efflux carrier n=1 Tax=Hymenoscyphus fraxineus TaxID=746836 RepID=A0A9N9PJM8_9HELO|nr:hypothetical protein HYFRA_00008870 [Hymenoscyphus fraxineus]
MSSLWPSFLGALQASLSVLLTMSYGIIASRCNIMKDKTARDITKICVRFLLPALLITNVGSEIQADTFIRYLPVLIWALLYTLSSLALGWVLNRAFKFPAWVIPAVAFNNTTSLPILLLKSLKTSGILKDLRMSGRDNTYTALDRATSYFLFASIVTNCLTFSIGPKLLDDEETPDVDEGEDKHEEPTNSSGRTQEQQEDHNTETTTLLPHRVVEQGSEIAGQISKTSKNIWATLPEWLQKTLSFTTSFLNAPLAGAIIGIILGLVPPFHRAFFNPPRDGGIFKSWLTSSLESMGDLFAALSLITVGAKLSSGLHNMKRGEDSSRVRMTPLLSVLFIRFLLWPVMSIAVIYAIVSQTNWLENDPVLWFVLMLLPIGPSATKLTSLAELSGAEEDEKMSIAKFLAISYAISPISCLAVVASLRASLILKEQIGG